MKLRKLYESTNLQEPLKELVLKLWKEGKDKKQITTIIDRMVGEILEKNT